MLPLRRVAALHVAEGRVRLDDALVAEVLRLELNDECVTLGI